ncbi:MAG: PTS fructose transporter subunit IIA, partial [Pseudomonadota bacterium]
MFGIVVVAHGDLAQELLAATAHVVGPQPATAAISIGPNEDITAKQAEV